MKETREEWAGDCAGLVGGEYPAIERQKAIIEKFDRDHIAARLKEALKTIRVLKREPKTKRKDMNGELIASVETEAQTRPAGPNVLRDMTQRLANKMQEVKDLKEAIALIEKNPDVARLSDLIRGLRENY